MTLKNLIEQQWLKSIDAVSIEQVKKRFESAMAYLNIAKTLFQNGGDQEGLNRVVYTNIYSAIRLIGEVLLLMHGYKATISSHHKTVIQASKLLLNDEKMEEVFARIDRMRKNRNSIDYDLDLLDVSDQTIKQAIKDAQQFAEQIQKHIDKKDKQSKLQF